MRSRAEPKIQSAQALRREKLSYYFQKNPSFYWSVDSRRFPILRFACLLLVWYVVAFLVAWYEGALRIPGPSRGLLEDWFMWAIFPTLVLAVTATRRLLRKVEELLQLFPDMLKPTSPITPEDVLGLDQRLNNIREAIAVRTKSSKKWHRIVLGTWTICVLLFQLFFPLTGLLGEVAWTVSPYRYLICYAFGIIWALFYYVLLIGNITWYVIATGFMVFPVVKFYADRDRLWIVPNAPDGQGGLSPIGAVAFGMTSVLGSGMVLIAIWILQFGLRNPSTVLAGVLYSTLVSIAFFWPLLSTHDAMRRAKQTELTRVAGLFRREYEQLPHSEAGSESARSPIPNSELASRLELMSKLDGVYGTVKSMPVWPFDLVTIRKFVFLVATPGLSAVIQKLWPTALSKFYPAAIVDGIVQILKEHR